MKDKQAGIDAAQGEPLAFELDALRVLDEEPAGLAAGRGACRAEEEEREDAFHADPFCQSAQTAPAGSRMTAILPCSPIARDGTTTLPPFSSHARTLSSTSATVM